MAAGRRPWEKVALPRPQRGVTGRQAKCSPTSGHAALRTGQHQCLSSEGGEETTHAMPGTAWHHVSEAPSLGLPATRAQGAD